MSCTGETTSMSRLNIIASMSDKKKEEKYCQENFNSDAEQGGIAIGLAVGIPITALVVAYLLYRIWYSYTQKKNNYEKIALNMHNFIKNSNISSSELNCNLTIPQPTINNQLPKPLKPCTCYYDTDLNIRGCTNNNNLLINNYNR
jgi:hypothetical protein